MRNERAIQTMMVVVLFTALADSLYGQVQEITYQGRLRQNGEAVEGPADFIFTLYDDEAGDW